MNELKEYIDEKGNVVAAVRGLGGKYIVARIAPNGSRKRVKSPKLPPRIFLETAQSDLDEYAKKNGWRVWSKKK